KKVLPGELTLPTVGHRLAARGMLISPREGLCIKATASGKLPFRFGRQFFPCPFRVGFSILKRDVDNRVLFETLERGSWPTWKTPACSRHPSPPVGVVVEIYRATRLL